MNATLSKAAPTPILAATFVVALAAPADALAIREALVQAYQNSPRLAAERARLRGIDEQVSQALSSWRPRVVVEGSAAMQESRFIPTIGPNAGEREGDSSHPYQAAVTVTQNIYRGGRNEAQTRRAEENILAGRARLSSVEQEVLLSALTAYVNVVRDRAVVELSVNNERVLKRQLEATSDRFRVGEVTRTDVALARSRLSRATAELIRARGNLADSRAIFADIVGVAADGLSEVEPLGNLPETEKDAVARARSDSFAVVAARHAERAARHSVDAVEGELLPTVSLSGRLSRALDATDSDVETDVFAVTGRVTVPLYQSGAVSSRVREAKHGVVRLRNESVRAVRAAATAATQRWEDYRTAEAAISAFSEAERAARIALEGVEQEALVGSRTVLHVLDAEQELLDARVSLVRARRDLVVASYALRSAVGRLTADSLGLEVDLYDPKANYRKTRERWYGLDIAK
ncbi:MAG: TolC family outer membrane protein [Defluviicoccus sp.]|nr:TolC family outer membrane protein [Defluviicoccus sp.]MDE0384124.1 TolC family outer membrane protein [Defluviicoccus sp.]